MLIYIKPIASTKHEFKLVLLSIKSLKLKII